jgi:hypothetical protein
MFHKSLEKKRANYMNKKLQLALPKCGLLSFGSCKFQAMSIQEHVYLTQSLKGDIALALTKKGEFRIFKYL